MHVRFGLFPEAQLEDVKQQGVGLGPGAMYMSFDGDEDLAIVALGDGTTRKMMEWSVGECGSIRASVESDKLFLTFSQPTLDSKIELEDIEDVHGDLYAVIAMQSPATSIRLLLEPPIEP